MLWITEGVWKIHFTNHRSGEATKDLENVEVHQLFGRGGEGQPKERTKDLQFASVLVVPAVR